MTAESGALIETCDSWDTLLTALGTVPAGRFVASSDSRSAAAMLAAPAAIARWIALAAPQLAMRSTLRVLVIGAEKLDAVDRGRWYQLIPVLLGTNVRVEVTLVGDRLGTAFLSPRAQYAPDAPAREHGASLATYLDSEGGTTHDLAFLFHPGFQKYHGWLQDGSLARVIATAIPVVAAAYEYDESEVDRRVVECYGFSASNEVLSNPYFVDLGDAGTCVRWGHVLWQFGPSVPGPHHAPDTHRLNQLEQLARMVMHSIALQLAPSRAYGAKTEFRAGGDLARTLVHVFDDFFVDLTNGQVLAFRAGELNAVASLSAPDLAAYPASSAWDLDRAIWAAEIKGRALLHLYPRLSDDEERRALGRSMHADLEHAVERLFQGSTRP